MDNEQLNVIPDTFEEAETLINNLYKDAKTEKAWDFKGFNQEGAPEQAKEKPAPKAAPVAKEEFEIDIDGQKFKFGKDEVSKYAQSGYKAEQKYQEILRERDIIAKERAEFEGKKGQYDHLRQLDDWAKNNPELYNRISLEHENMKNGGDFGDVPPYLSKFVSELEKIKSRFSEIDNFSNQQKIKAQDSALDKEIGEFKSAFPQFDWNDKQLERSILEHATKNNLPSFRAAARDLLFDDLLKRNELKVKDNIGKEIQRNTKLGEVQKRSEGLVNQNSKSIDVKRNNWSQIADRVKKSYGLN